MNTGKSTHTGIKIEEFQKDQIQFFLLYALTTLKIMNKFA
jgi:predicted NACHT family NTPase